jgi:hypothetical protein
MKPQNPAATWSKVGGKFKKPQNPAATWSKVGGKFTTYEAIIAHYSG